MQSGVVLAPSYEVKLHVRGQYGETKRIKSNFLFLFYVDLLHDAVMLSVWVCEVYSTVKQIVFFMGLGVQNGLWTELRSFIVLFLMFSVSGWSENRFVCFCWCNKQCRKQEQGNQSSHLLAHEPA